MKRFYVFAAFFLASVCAWAQPKIVVHNNSLSWSYAQGSVPAVGFHVWRAAVSGGYNAVGTIPYAVISSPTTLTYKDQGGVPIPLVEGATLYYALTAFDANGNDSALSNEVSCTTPFSVKAPSGLQGDAK